MLSFLDKHLLEIITFFFGISTIGLFLSVFIALSKQMQSNTKLKYEVEKAKQELETKKAEAQLEVLKTKLDLQSFDQYSNELREFILYVKEDKRKSEAELETAKSTIQRYKVFFNQVITDFLAKAHFILKYENPSNDQYADIISVFEVIDDGKYYDERLLDALTCAFLEIPLSSLRRRISEILLKRYKKEKISEYLLKNYIYISHDAIGDFKEIFSSTYTTGNFNLLKDITKTIQNRESSIRDPLISFMRDNPS